MEVTLTLTTLTRGITTKGEEAGAFPEEVPASLRAGVYVRAVYASA